MTETNLNILYYQTLFIRQDETLENFFIKKNDIIEFINGIYILIKHTDFFAFKKTRATQLRKTIMRIIKQNHSFYDKNLTLSKKIVEIIEYCENIEKNISPIELEINEDSFIYYEAKKRNFPYNLVLSEKIEESILVEYEIICSLVKDQTINKTFKLPQLLNAFSLLVTTYRETLYENPKMYFFITTYLQVLIETINLEALFHKNRMKIILEQYKKLENIFSNEEQFLFTFQNKEKI